MKWALAVSLLLPYVAAALPPYKRFEPRADGIEWGPCPGSPNDSIECGYFEVPLDWANDSAGKARLGVARYSATNTPRKGAILTNPGGPGGSGIDLILGYGQLMSNLTGGYYDIVSWDPRGVGYTTPGLINCFDSIDAWAEFWNGTLVYPQIDIKTGFTDPDDLTYFNSQVDVMDKRWEAFGEICLKHETGQYLPYVGTTATVRDLVAIAEYFDGKGCDINYYGLSYGTTIGNYLINMFPDRVGRIILDGIEDPVTHASLPSHLYWAHRVESVDETYQGFTQGCALAGPKGCPLSTTTSTGPGILQWTIDLLAIAHDYAKSSGIDNYKSINLVGAIHGVLYTPDRWADFASGTFVQFYQAVVQASGTNLPLATRSIIPEMKRQSGQDWPDYTFQAISCGDSIDESNITSQAVFDELIRVVKDVSPMFGGQFPQPAHYCHKWPARAIERFTGPWDHKLKNPIIIIGNKADPATPFLDASTVAGFLGDSATLVEQDGFGHLSLAQKSTCTLKIIANFFINGVSPQGDDTICPIDADGPPLFPSGGVTASDIRSAVSTGGNNTSSDSGDSDLAHLKSQKKNLFIAVIALAAACGVLLISLIFTCITGKRGKGYKRIGTREAQGQKAGFVGYGADRSYSDPYDRDVKH